MFSDMPIQFERPIWLVLLLLIIPAYFMARRSIGGLSRGKATAIFALRVIVILLLATAMAQPIWEKRGEGLTVSLLIDRSQSIPLPLKASSFKFLEKATAVKPNRADRLAVITIAKEANIAAMPDKFSQVTAGNDDGDGTATNLAAGVRMALAIMPNDTTNRVLLVSDGNETVDSVMAAAEVAKANKVPIDVLVLEYEHRNEVIFERLIAPARIRQGQTANLKMVLRSQNDAPGRVRLLMNDRPVDLNGDDPGDELAMVITAGPAQVFQVPILLDKPGPHRFEAVFEPDDPADDEIDRNNRGVGVTFVAGEGRVLVLDADGSASEYLVRALRQSRISVDVEPPGVLAGGPVMLAGYDAVVLANIPRHAIDDDRDKALHAYVHDLGGGLIMLGGDQSFGAGGWIGSELAKALPVKLDPPQTRQMTRGALALIMHSCEMPQGNFWGQRIAIAAIEALSSQDYVGIVEFNWGAGGSGASWAHPMSMAGDKSAAIASAKKMTVGDMPDFDASMKVAYDGLIGVRAGQRHAIIISDGDPSPPTPALLQAYIDAKITCTTVMVAGHGSAQDLASMKKTADSTGGTFYNVTNPKSLPEIFIKEAQLVSRSLIQEGQVYQPQVGGVLPGPIEGFPEVPAIDGYVLTAMRDGLTQTPIVINTSEGADPVYAYWNYGLGKAVAFTTSVEPRWGHRWAGWERFRAFWTQSIRWAMRPSSPANFHVETRQQGDTAVVEVRALDADASFLNFLQTSAVVLRPDSTAEPLHLQQVGPGLYRGEFRTVEAGAYLVNVSYAAGGSSDTASRGNLQAAVSVPYAREFKDVRHNAALLHDLATRTGGRILSAADPSLIEVFEPTGLPIPKSPREIWDLLAIIAAMLFLVDVAARRVTVDPKWVAALAARAVGRRADASGDTVAAWKRARTQVGHRKEPATAQAASAAKSTVPLADRKARFEAGEDDAKRAIDVGAEVPADMRAKPQAAPKAKPQPTPEDDGDYTSRLLAAKRRARGGDEPEDKGKDKV